MSLPATEDFAGTGALSANWTAQTGDPRRTADEGEGGSVGANNSAFWNADVFNNDQYSKAIVRSIHYPAVTVRQLGTGSGRQGYQFTASDAFGGIYRTDAGIDALIQSITTSPSSGDEIKITVEGSTIRAWVNGVQVGTDQADATYASGSAGFTVFPGSVVADGHIDNWEGGNLAAASPLSPTAAQRFLRGKTWRAKRRAA